VATVLNVTTKVMDTSETKMTCPFMGYSNHTHKGVDLIPKSTSETPHILAYADGVVIYTGNINGTNKSTGNAGMGTCVAIKHNDGTFTRYQHMKYNSLKVKKGDKVKKGQILGLYGRPTSGNSTGSHLHFDISLPKKPDCPYLKGTFCNETRYYVDPVPYLTKPLENNNTNKPSTIKKTGKVTASVLNVRKGPGTGYKVVDTLEKGKTVTIYETKNGFYRIGENKWVSAEYVKV